MLRMLVGAACAAMCLALIGAAISEASWGLLVLLLALAYMSCGWVDKGLVDWLGRSRHTNISSYTPADISHAGGGPSGPEGAAASPLGRDGG